MLISIFRNNILVTQVRPDNNSEYTCKKELQDRIRLSFRSDTFIELKIGDFIIYEKNGLQYYLNEQPRVLSKPREYSYECYFETGIHEFQKVKVFLETPKVGGGSYLDYRFPLTGTAQTFLQFIVNVLNNAGGNYTVGDYEETASYTIDFNNWNVYETIQVLAQKIGFNWYLEGGVLNFKARENQTTHVFQVGMKNGFESLTRMRLNNTSLFTVVYGYGSTKNLPPRTNTGGATYDGPTLTENRLAFVGVGGESKLTKNIDLYGVRETVVEFDDIFPEFTGTVTDVIDTHTFTDQTIDFDINNYLLEGITAKVTFLDGRLVGQTFSIAYDHDSFQITLTPVTDPSGQYPNTSIIMETGDTYKIFDIAFPESYIATAMTRLQTRTEEHLDDVSTPQEQYEAKVDKDYLRSRGLHLYVGDVIRVVSTKFNLDQFFEINEIVQKITDPYQYTIKFGDVLPINLANLFRLSIFSVQQEIQNITNNSVTNNQIQNIEGDTVEWEQL